MAEDRNHPPKPIKIQQSLFIVPNKDGSLRIVQDFCLLNAKCYKDRYSMKDINECIGDMGCAGSTIFTTLDQTPGFWPFEL
jgi:hypothetical protein